jgi:hypothetical protein
MRESILALLLMLAITVPVVAKKRDINDYPMSITIKSVSYGGDCHMSISDDAGGGQAISSNGLCYTFAPGTVLRARRCSFLGVQMIEFMWEKNGKSKTAKYRIDSAW